MKGKARGLHPELTEKMNTKSTELRNGWFIATDPENIGKNEGWENNIHPNAVSAYVPSVIQQFFPEYHGVAYYWCKFTPELSVSEGERVLLRFGGVDYKAEVWLNRRYLGSYEGGETPFLLDISSEIEICGENLLAVRVVNPHDKDIDGLNLMNIPHRNKMLRKIAGNNLNHGGIWYGVSLAVIPKISIEDKFLTGDIATGEISLRLTLHSVSDSEHEGNLTVSVYRKGMEDAPGVSKSWRITASNGSSDHLLSITVPDHKLWSVDDPNLYRLEIALETEFGIHRQQVSFGFREFKVKDGYFYLNGKKIFLKCSHSGNVFPIGLMHPVRPEQMRQDFIYAKACGFNMLRAIAGLFRPEQLELADELGLLIYEECFASWCVGYSQIYAWDNAEEYEVISRNPENLKLGDETAMISRWIGATEKMILRDRNHPSVVIWGFLNETKNNGIYRAARDFLPRARELDPSRMVILNSGRWDRELSVGSASNPGSLQWENTWGTDGHPELLDPDHPYERVGDNHYYAPTPLSERDIKFYRTFGADMPLPVFLSEFGVGATFHVIEELKHFMQYGERLDLEDSSWLKAQSEAFTRDFYRFGLEKLFPFPESLLKESQRINADERKRTFDILRSNSRLAGYSLTGLFDHGMCGEGLWSYWRRWKPGMFDAVSDGFSPLRFSLFVQPTVYSGEPFTVEAVLANDGVLKDGVYTADFAITGENGVITGFTESFTLENEDFSVPVMKKTLNLTLPEGRYELTASLREGAAAGVSTEFFVFEKREATLSDKTVYAIGFDNSELCALRCVLGDIKPYENENDAVILVGSVDPDTVHQLLCAAERGAKILFLNKDIFADQARMDELKALDEGLELECYHDWLYHKECALLSREVFRGIPGKLAGLTLFGSVFPHHVFTTPNVPDHVLCPAFVTGFYKVPGSYASMHAMLGYERGKGAVYLNTMSLTENIGSPVADRILLNMTSMLCL